MCPSGDGPREGESVLRGHSDLRRVPAASGALRLQLHVRVRFPRLLHGPPGAEAALAEPLLPAARLRLGAGAGGAPAHAFPLYPCTPN